jgi:hypothetical protein
VNKVLLLVCAVLLCSACSLRDVQHTTNAYNLYGNADIKEEIVWSIRSAVGQ